MGTQNCKYHPDVPARWECRHCQINFCKTCIPQQDERYTPSCPVCQRQLFSLGSGNLVTPFWKRLGKFFLYPLRLNSLLFIGLLTIIGVILSTSLIGLLFTIVLLFVFLKYCFSVIENTACGHLEPLPVSQLMLSREMELPFKFFVLLIAIGIGIGIIGQFLGPIPMLIAMVVSNIALPANVMVLAIEHSIFAALNPAVVFSVIFRIGAPYLFLIFLLMLLQGSQVVSQKILISLVPQEALAALISFVSMFFTVVMAHLLGYVLYQYHEVLGYQVEKEEESDNKKNPSQVALPQELRTAEILVHEGKHQEAAKILADYLRHNPTDKEANTRYLKLLQLTGDKKELIAKAQKYISYLFAQNDPSYALSVFHRIHDAEPTFRPAQPDERLAIARSLQQSGNYRAAVSILNNLHVDFPNYKNIPEAYLLVAKGLCEGLNLDSKAKKVLQFLMQKYPDSELQDEIKSYYQVVNQLGTH